MEVFKNPVKIVEAGKNRVVLSFNINETPRDFKHDSIYETCQFIAKHTEELLMVCFSCSDQHLSDFGPGSQWLCEMGCKFNLCMTAEEVILTVTR